MTALSLGAMPQPSAPLGQDEAVFVSIVMPCLNEKKTVGVCVQKALKMLRDNKIEGEVLIADNGSTDGSPDIARLAGARVVDVPQKGYGSALQGGIVSAKGNFIIMGDCDDSYDFNHVPRFIEKLSAGFDLVMGNRFAGGIEKNAMPFLHKYLGNPVLSAIGRLLFKSECRDFHCGLRGFRREAMVGLNLSSTGMEFASEMIILASINHLKITEVPTTLTPDGRGHRSHLRTWRDGWRHLKFMLQHCPKWLFLYPGLTLILVGLCLGVALIAQPLRFGSVRLDIHTLMYCGTAVEFGVQMVLFWMIAQAATGAPKSRTPEKITFWTKATQWANLEFGLILGATLALAGIAGSIFGVYTWDKTSFGDLDPTRTLRLVIPSCVSFMIGVQLFFSSFVASVIQMRRANAEKMEKAIRKIH